ncbi:hypothetical protein MVEN_01396700 [Mycena venus]|uniref:F-box domain-containing protein n=1 Tax=Mycena venus TaxID=2733690 RepID=A0A8H6XYT7_9AGAR|nr:hypothetical protein MVEN_01396700 [Mycena venus]
MLLHLPQELVDSVVEELDDSSLPICALASKSFLHPSQRRIFRCINFHGAYPPGDRRFESLCSVLSESPHLVSYVRAVVVRLDIARFYRVARLLRACTRLGSLAICFTAQVVSLDMPNLPMELIDALLCRIASASLHHLEIWGQAGLLMPDSLLHFAVTSVRSLALRRITINQDPHSQARYIMARYRAPPVVHLQHLTFDLMGRQCISAARLIDYKKFGFLQGLQKLTLIQWSDRFVPLLEATAQTLQEFRVDLAAALWQGDTVFPHFPALSVVELRLPVDDPEWDNTQAPPTVQRLLRAAPLLKQLTIFYKARSEPPLRPRVPPSPWAVFDPLRPKERPRHLRVVKCFLCFPLNFQGDKVIASDNFASWVEAQMPTLSGTPLLTCSQGAPAKYASWDEWPA